MLEFQGKHGKAKVMIDDIDQSTISQIYEFLNHEVFTNPIVIMPDTHAGNGAVIGFTMEMTDKVIPNVVGVDIGCGMRSINVGKGLLAEHTKSDIDAIIRKNIPFGTLVHNKNHFDLRQEKSFWDICNSQLRSFVMKYNKRYMEQYDIPKYSFDWLEKKCSDIKIDLDRVVKSIGTLGGGNHFIEISKAQNTGDYWITVHSGSRQFGLKIATYWQKKAGRGPLSHLEGDNMFGYLRDMLFAQCYAEVNRGYMVNTICDLLDLEKQEDISSVHNFIDFNDFIIRKGAIRSYSDEKMIIPFNMEDGILICMGKSNPDWNFSAPHGAGRLGSRRWAKETLNLDDAKHRMEKNNIFFSTLPKDELKGAYKDPSIIESAIEPTAIIIDRLKPIIAMKD